MCAPKHLNREGDGVLLLASPRDLSNFVLACTDVPTPLFMRKEGLKVFWSGFVHIVCAVCRQGHRVWTGHTDIRTAEQTNPQLLILETGERLDPDPLGLLDLA